jgi:hypothetical protein
VIRLGGGILGILCGVGSGITRVVRLGCCFDFGSLRKGGFVMAAEVSVKWWKANEPKLVKHADWEKDVMPALLSWESTKKSINDAGAGTTNLGFFYKKLNDWGVHLKKVIQAKHDGLNKLVHGETRKKLEELLGVLAKEVGENEAKMKAFELVAAKEKQLNPNMGRPLPKLPPSKNDVLTKLEQNH